jgi:hypothetical protein
MRLGARKRSEMIDWDKVDVIHFLHGFCMVQSYLGFARRQTGGQSTRSDRGDLEPAIG